MQAGGDTAENYFKQTESIAGIRDGKSRRAYTRLHLMSCLVISATIWVRFDCHVRVTSYHVYTF